MINLDEPKRKILFDEESRKFNSLNYWIIFNLFDWFFNSIIILIGEILNPYLGGLQNFEDPMKLNQAMTKTQSV